MSVLALSPINISITYTPWVLITTFQSYCHHLEISIPEFVVIYIRINEVMNKNFCCFFKFFSAIFLRETVFLLAFNKVPVGTTECLVLTKNYIVLWNASINVFEKLSFTTLTTFLLLLEFMMRVEMTKFPY